jgi:hypothetical protein
MSRSKERVLASTSKHSKDTDEDEVKTSRRVIRGGVLSYETPKNEQDSREPSRSNRGKHSTGNGGNSKNTRQRKGKEDDEDSNPSSEDEDNWGSNPSTDPSDGSEGETPDESSDEDPRKSEGKNEPDRPRTKIISRKTLQIIKEEDKFDEKHVLKTLDV